MAAEAARLNSYRDAELTLEDLVAAASKLLTHLDLHQDDGRIAQVPDARGIRYYQTVGVLDRPLRYDGRHAIYGFRHLLQLLAVKRLQQEGHPLHLIQQSLAGRPTAALEQALGAMLSGSGQAWQAESPEPVAALMREPISAPAPASLIAVRLSPGVTITIDPELVEKPDAVIAHVAGILAHINKEH